MTDPAVLREYRRIRKAEPFVGAKNALLWARSIVSPALPEGVEETDEARGAATVLARGTTEGFEVIITTEPDYDAEPRGTFTDTWSEAAIVNPAWRGPRDRDTFRYFESESGETLAGLTEGYRRMGMARHVAYTQALANLREEARRAGGETEAYVVKARVSRAGITLGEAALWGCDVSGTSWKVDRAYLLDTGTEVLSEALHEAREALARLVATA